jgi:hypothetical protein
VGFLGHDGWPNYGEDWDDLVTVWLPNGGEATETNYQTTRMDSTYFYVKIDNNSDLSGFKEYFYLWSTVPDEEPPIIDDRRYAVPLFTEYHLGEGHRATSSLSAGTYDFAPLGPIDLSEVSPFSVSAMRIYATANTGKSQGGDYGLWVYDVGDMSIVGKDYQDRPNPYDSTLPILQSTLGNNFYPPELEHFQSADFIETAGDTLVSRWYNSSKWLCCTNALK